MKLLNLLNKYVINTTSVKVTLPSALKKLEH